MGSYATAFAHTPRAPTVGDPMVAELDISRPDGGRGPQYVPLLTDEEARHAASFASKDGSAYVCWLCRTYGHAMYACPFLSPEQRMFTAYRNYRYQIETRPGARNLLRQSVGEGRPPRQGFPNRSGRGVRFAPRGGGYRRSELDARDRRDFRQADTRYPRQEGRGSRDRYRLPQEVQDAIMYLQHWAEDTNPLPSDEQGGALTLAAPQVLQRPDAATQGRDVPEYFADATNPEGVYRLHPLDRGPDVVPAIGDGATSSDSPGSTKNSKRRLRSRGRVSVAVSRLFPNY